MAYLHKIVERFSIIDKVYDFAATIQKKREAEICPLWVRVGIHGGKRDLCVCVCVCVLRKCVCVYYIYHIHTYIRITHTHTHTHTHIHTHTYKHTHTHNIYIHINICVCVWVKHVEAEICPLWVGVGIHGGTRDLWMGAAHARAAFGFGAIAGVEGAVEWIARGGWDR